MDFPANSRYQNLAQPVYVLPDGTKITYLERRFCPLPSSFATVGTRLVLSGDRLDNIAAQTIGDPLLFWRLCDANGAMRPQELTEATGRSLLIPLPIGVPGGRIA